MDTTVGLGELVVPVGPDLAIPVREERCVAITSDPNAQGAYPRLSTAIIQRTRPSAQGQAVRPVVIMPAPRSGQERLYWWQILPVLGITRKQAIMGVPFSIMTSTC